MQTISLQCCNEPSLSAVANSLLMEAGLQEDQRLVKALCEWAELQPSTAAGRAGLAATTLTRHFKGTAETRLGRTTLQKLRAAFPGFPGWYDDEHRIRSEVAPTGIDDPRQEKYGRRELPPIPVVGSAIGVRSFDPEQYVELTELDLGEVLDHVARPASLAGDKGAYAVTIVGDSMWPRFRPGRRLIVSPKAPVSIGDDVIVQLKGDDIQTAPTSPDRITSVLIKELARRSATYIELRQFNPDVTFKVPTNQVAAIHKVIGELY